MHESSGQDWISTALLFLELPPYTNPESTLRDSHLLSIAVEWCSKVCE